MEPIVNPSDVVVRPILTSEGMAELVASLDEVNKLGYMRITQLLHEFTYAQIIVFGAYDVRAGGDGVPCGMIAVDSVISYADLPVMQLLSIERSQEALPVDGEFIALPLLNAAIETLRNAGAPGINVILAGPVDPYMASVFERAGLSVAHTIMTAKFPASAADEYPEDTKDERRFSLLSDLDDNAAIRVSHDDFHYMASQRPGNLVLPLCHDEHSFFRDNVDRPLTQFVLHDNHHNHQAAYAAVQAEYDDNEFAVGARIQWLFTRPDLSPESVSALMGYIQHALGGSEDLRFWAPKQSIKDVVHQLNGAPINIEGH